MRASSGGPSNRGAPLGFWRIHTSPGAIEGALHARHEPVTGSGMTGFQCSISVDDVEAAAVAVKQHGGVLKHEPFLIETVGTVLTFTDTEGNVVSAMQYL